MAESRVEPILVLTEDADLLDDVLRLCAAAGAEAQVAHGAPVNERDWRAAPLVVVGEDRAGPLRAAPGGLPRRPGVVLVGRNLDNARMWEHGVRLGAEEVVFLPDAETWLAGRIADSAEGISEQALTVGVAGGRGGAGASVLACALAVTAAAAGHRALLVDGDPLGGGLDVLLGGESAEGLRWPAFAESRGRVGAGALEESLPRLHGVRVLSWGRTADAAGVGADAMRAVLAAARRRGGVVVVDVPRRLDDAAAEALRQLDVGLLLVPADLRAVAAAQHTASLLAMAVGDLRVVTRGPFTAGLDGAEIAGLLGLPLVGELPADPALPAAVDLGVPPGTCGGPLTRFCTAFWTRALAGGARGSVAA
ncbi:septum site-determining protein Ssd [Streptomyces sp. TRM 70351]|uniref:septum site-determining protein Ssd n=1 Tax=Streptomyces sp. TRM 70351 TaxID=3116552 RepID=UPI002E7ACE52|nr:septum site-determining protein Ssd [Streptomyces sp. TRM 70351]MEE1930272.1 septum site-determining protein Ssd [Streptomyces sp. TRM 70351]